MIKTYHLISSEGTVNKKWLDKKFLNICYHESTCMDDCELVLYSVRVCSTMNIFSNRNQKGFRHTCMYMYKYTPTPLF